MISNKNFFIIDLVLEVIK